MSERERAGVDLGGGGVWDCNPPLTRDTPTHVYTTIVPSEAMFLLVLSRDRMASGHILHTASKRSLLLATTTLALSLSSREFMLTRLLQFCWT